MKYTIENVPLQGSPHRHTSLVSQNSLAVLGGKFKSRGGLSKLTWTGLSLHWKNGTKFRADFSDSCAVKLAADVHILFGGEHLVNHQKKQRAQVIKINTTEQVALEMNPMQYARKSHGCELLNDSLVLLSGGLDQSVTFLVSKPVSKPKCQSQECDIFGFDTGFETKMSFSGLDAN